jgi:hypothetical protein
VRRPIAEIMEERNALDDEAQGTDAALRKKVSQRRTIYIAFSKRRHTVALIELVA